MGVRRVQLLTLLPWYLKVSGRVGGSWPCTVVDSVHVGTRMSMVGWEVVGLVQLLTLFTVVHQGIWSCRRELAGYSC